MARKISVIIGERYGELTLLEEADDYVSPTGKHHKRFHCICENGHNLVLDSRYVKKGTCSYCKGKALLVGFNDFKTVFPEVASEWDYQKNDGLMPEHYLPHSNRQFWWKCSTCGRSWLAAIGTRTQGHGCPYCAHHKASETNNLAVVAPNLAAEWNYSRNGTLRPEDIAPNYNSKVWWICKRGHEWQAKPNNRINGRGCRLCSAELRSSFPEQAIYFYLSKFFDVFNRSRISGWEVDVFLPQHNIAVEYDGIAWHSSSEVAEREYRKNLSLQNAGIYLIRVKETLDEALVDDNLIKYIVDANYSNLAGAITQLIEIISKKAGTKIACEIDLDRDRLEILSAYIKLEKEKSFAEIHPDLVRFWNIEKNFGLKPEQFPHRSNRKIWWKCDSCGGEWQETIINVSKGNRCPYCSGHKVLYGYNDLLTTNPELNTSWDYEKNGDLLPTMLSSGSNKKVWWKCEKNHSWKAFVYSRANGIGCPYCANKTYLMKPTQKQNKMWMAKFFEAQKYYEENGNLEIPAVYTTDSGVKLGSWIRTQRMQYTNGNLLTERQVMLEEIGMVWKVKCGSKKKV